MRTVLFVCTGNQYRSPIAAEVFRSQLVQDGRAAEWTVNSAGTWTSSGQHPPQEALELARSHGVTIDGHKTRRLTANMLAESDLVVVMEAGHKESIKADFPFAREKVHLLSQVVEGITYDIPDPATANREARAIIGELVAMIRAGYMKIYRIAEAG
jgi:protein-tyrosine phosphatase